MTRLRAKQIRSRGGTHRLDAFDASSPLRFAAASLARGILLGTWISLAAGTAHGAEGIPQTTTKQETSESDAWRFSIAVSLEAQQQRAEGQISSSLATGQEQERTPPFAQVPVPLDADTHDDYFVPIIPIELEVQTPAISLPRTDLAPRAFFQAGYQFVPITERDFLVAGKFVPLPPAPTAASQGLGGELRIDLQHQWSLSAGLSFPLEIEGIPIEIRPSVEYMGQWVRADSKVIGVQIGTDALFEIESDDTGALHYLGPALSIETEAGRMGNTRWVFFAEGAVLFSDVAGTQELEKSAVESGETSHFSYEPDALLFRVGAGFRMYWDPVRRSAR